MTVKRALVAVPLGVVTRIGLLTAWCGMNSVTGGREHERCRGDGRRSHDPAHPPGPIVG